MATLAARASPSQIQAGVEAPPPSPDFGRADGVWTGADVAPAAPAFRAGVLALGAGATDAGGAEAG
ncbi:MAG: hypothetical protein ACHQ7M_14520, partial [Chloroflexota bacterium]